MFRKNSRLRPEPAAPQWKLFVERASPIALALDGPEGDDAPAEIDGKPETRVALARPTSSMDSPSSALIKTLVHTTGMGRVFSSRTLGFSKESSHPLRDHAASSVITMQDEPVGRGPTPTIPRSSRGDSPPQGVPGLQASTISIEARCRRTGSLRDDPRSRRPGISSRRSQFRRGEARFLRFGRFIGGRRQEADGQALLAPWAGQSFTSAEPDDGCHDSSETSARRAPRKLVVVQSSVCIMANLLALSRANTLLGPTLPDSEFYKLLHEFLNGRSRGPASDATARIAGDLTGEGSHERGPRRRKDRRRVMGNEVGRSPVRPG